MNRTLLTILAVVFHVYFAFSSSERIEELTQKLANATDTSKVDILNELSREYEYSDKEKSRFYADEAINLGRKIEYYPGIINGFMNISFLLQIEGKTEEGIEILDSAINLCINNEHKALLSNCYGRLAGMHFTRGEINDAKHFAQMSLDIGSELDSMKLKLTGFQLLGMIHGTNGEYEKALDYFFKLLDYHTSNKDELNMASFLKNIGQTYRMIGKYDEAIEYLERAYEIQSRLKNSQQEVWILTAIGSCYSNSGDQERALGYYQQSLDLAREIHYSQMIINNLNQIGQYYISQSNYNEAQEYLSEAYELNEKQGQNSHTIYLLGSLSEIYLELNRIPESIEFGRKQFEIAKKENIFTMIQGASNNLSEAYSKIGDFEQAYFYQQELMTAKDSIYTIEKSKQIEEITTRYETEKKDREIVTLAQEKQNAEFRRNLYGIIAVLVFVFGITIYNQQRIRTKKNKLLLEKEKQLDQMKSRFFANISHEFRTPLTLILGPLDDIAAKIEQTDIKKQLRVMKRSASRLLDLVNQLLELSKIESGKLKLDITRSDIIKVIKGVAMSFHSVAEQKNIDIEMGVAPDSLPLNYDRPKVETILTNLLSNAFKFVPENGQVTVGTEVHKQGKEEFVVISVADNGPGIAQDDVDQIFNRFYQSDNNQLLQQEGSGIGLALAKELVELHGGNIDVESEIGSGTQITVKIPTDISLPENGIDNEKEISKVKPSKSHGEVSQELPEAVIDNRLPTLLVIEDNVDVLNYISEILEKEYNVQTAKDGEEGIERAFSLIPDLIISDVMMPVKDGYTVCKELKQDERTSHIPIVLLTAKSDSEDKIVGLTTAADDYVTKPFVPRELLARIQNLIESRRRLREKYKEDGVLRPKEITTNSIDEKFLDKIVDIVEIKMSDEKFGVENLGKEMGMSRSQLHRKLTALLGQGPNQFIRSFRLQRAHDLLKQNSATASEIAYQVGFGSPSYFTKCFHEQFGYTPSEIPM